MLRRLVQAACFSGFTALLSWAILGTSDTTPFEWLLGLDPALSGLTVLAARAVVWAFLPAAVLIVLALVFGRGFCGYVCPMGALVDTLDAMMHRLRPRRPRWRPGTGRHAKYAILGFLTGAAALGLSLAYAASPFSLMTRLLGLIVYPIVMGLADLGLLAARPLAEAADWNFLLFAKVEPPQFDTQLFLLGFLGALAGMAILTPRFWCRYICPAGSLLALASFRPLVRRRVSGACGGCALCADVCPMGAIDVDDFHQTRHEDCILCRSCQDVCAKSAVSFLPDATAEAPVPSGNAAPSQARRHFVIGGLAGAGTAAFPLVGMAVGPVQAQDPKPVFVRPPGAVPEDEFLDRCVRCAACIAVCPPNALQALYAETGITALFSPGLVPASGPCDPQCARCGEVCPTGAIRELAGDERLWAKTGTAAIDRETCIAWKDGEKCMVCDEVRPYDAVVFGLEPGRAVSVPHVEAERCAGCGYCEHECPVKQPAAIRVFATDALRLSDGSYAAEGRARGLSIALDTKPHGPEGYGGEGSSDGGLAPGFDGPAPGFSP